MKAGRLEDPGTVCPGPGGCQPGRAGRLQPADSPAARRKKWMMGLSVVLVIACGVGVLARLKAIQKLGLPAVTTSAAADKNRLNVELPAAVLDYSSEKVEVDDITLGALPPDTSFGQRRYKAADGFETMLNVVLMGSDRTSLHKPQFCLRGAGLEIASGAKTNVRVEKPFAYELPVMRLNVVHEKQRGAQGVYVYWFVADGEYTAEHWQRMWWMARDLLQTGVLQRWAYITVFAPCRPGEEDATFERLKTFIAAAAPEFQLTPKSPAGTATAAAAPGSQPRTAAAPGAETLAGATAQPSTQPLH